MFTIDPNPSRLFERKIYNFTPFKFERIKSRTKNKNQKPTERSGHRIGANSGNFYSFGGYNPALDEIDNNEENGLLYPLLREIWRFNFASRTWYKYPNTKSLPSELASNAIIIHRNLLMVYGGTGSPFGYRSSNQLYLCKVNDKSGTMTEIKTTGLKPLPMYGQALIFHNDSLYSIGGTSGLSYNCDIHRLDLKSNEWEAVYICKGQQDCEPEGRYRHEVGFDGKVIYLLGGGTSEQVFDLEKIPSFNLQKKEWNYIKTLRDLNHDYPKARRCHSATQIEVNGSIEVFIVGGYNGDDIFDDLWKINLKTFQWTFYERCALPRPTYFHAAAASPEGRLYIFGGIYDSSDLNLNRSNAVLSMWLCIPKLSEICWEALLFYYPDIVNLKHDSLCDIGLPKKFVNRLPNYW